MPSNGTSDPTLTLPSSEEVSAGSTTPISGISYSDSFAASNPGQLYLDITDSSGTLSATDSEGAAPGSGSDAITLSASYADITDILNSLTYTAASTPGSDTISFDIWDQAGIQTTGSIPVGIAAAGGGATETWTGATSGDWNTASNWSGGTVPSSNDTAVITDITQTNVPTLATATPVGETIIVTQGATNDVVAGELNLSGATINSLLEAQGVGNTSVSNGLTIASVGTVTSGANSILNIYGPEELIENNGLLTAAAGGKLDLIAGPPASQGTSSLTNNGSIVANGGSVNIESISSFPGALPDWTVNNDFGTIVTENGGAVTVNGTIDGGQIVFNGTASLTLEQPQALIGGAELFDFGPGDRINLIGSAYGTIAGFSGNALEIGSAGSIERIPFSGGFGLGNFEDETTTDSSGNASSIIAFADPGMASGVTNPDISAPAVDTIAHGTTLSLGSVAVTYMNDGTIDNAGSISLTIDAGSGTLYMNGATGSGTNQISTGMISVAQANADLATLNYVAGAGASSDTVSIDAAAASSQTLRAIPITVAGSVSSGPTLTEPSSEDVAAGGTVAVSGSYSDSFAQSNSGDLFLGINDNSGTLSATDASGNPVAGSGSNSIAVSTDYTDLNAVLSSLRYTAGASSGSDAISFDIWNQAGAETTGSVPIVITGGTGGTTATWTGAVDGDWNTAGNWSDGAVPMPGDTAVVPGGVQNDPTVTATTLSGETIDLNSNATGIPTIVFINATLDSTLINDGGLVQVGGSLTIGAHGTLQPAAGVGTSVEAGGLVALTNNGLIASATGGIDFENTSSNLSQTGTLTNNGTLLVDGGSIGLSFIVDAAKLGTSAQEDLANSGTVTVSNGGALGVNGTISGNPIDFAGPGGIELDVNQAFAGGSGITGFGQGDYIALVNTAEGQVEPLGFSNGTLDIQSGGSLVQAIPMGTGYALGNFEETVTPGVATTITYAASDEPSGAGGADIVAPASANVSQGSTLSLGDVAIQFGGPDASVSITAGSGTLYMNGGTGSGTNHVTVGGSPSQVNADLASLSYVPAAGATSDTVQVNSVPNQPTGNYRWIPISIGGSSGPALSEPSTENVASSGSVAVAGSYSDSFAASNPGDLFLGISDSSGTLSATDASGNPVSGSGTNSIAVSTDYVDVNAILAGLHYTAGSASGTDQISFQVWNQAGVETTGMTAVTIDPPGGSTMASAMQPGANELASNFSTGIANTPTLQAGAPSSAFGLEQQAPVVGVMPIGH